MISYASVPGRGIVIALCVLFVVVTVVVVRTGRRRRERAGGEPVVPCTVAEVAGPPAMRAIEAPPRRIAEPATVNPVPPPPELFPAPARWPGMNNSRFGRRVDEKRRFAGAPSRNR